MGKGGYFQLDSPVLLLQNYFLPKISETCSHPELGSGVTIETAPLLPRAACLVAALLLRKMLLRMMKHATPTASVMTTLVLWIIEPSNHHSHMPPHNIAINASP